jgi:hypothetical protein
VVFLTDNNTTPTKLVLCCFGLLVGLWQFTYRYTVLLYTTCTDELYVCVHNSYKQDIHYMRTHMDIALYIYRFLYRHTVLLYYCTHLVKMNSTFVYTTSPVSVRLYFKFVPTNESPSKITLMNRVDQSQLRFLGIAPSLHLNCSRLTTSFPNGNRCGKK